MAIRNELTGTKISLLVEIDVKNITSCVNRGITRGHMWYLNKEKTRGDEKVIQFDKDFTISALGRQLMVPAGTTATVRSCDQDVVTGPKLVFELIIDGVGKAQLHLNPSRGYVFVIE